MPHIYTRIPCLDHWFIFRSNANCATLQDKYAILLCKLGCYWSESIKCYIKFNLFAGSHGRRPITATICGADGTCYGLVVRLCTLKRIPHALSPNLTPNGNINGFSQRKSINLLDSYMIIPLLLTEFVFYASSKVTGISLQSTPWVFV